VNAVRTVLLVIGLTSALDVRADVLPYPRPPDGAQDVGRDEASKPREPREQKEPSASSCRRVSLVVPLIAIGALSLAMRRRRSAERAVLPMGAPS
jgi:hypothetical protein